MPNIYVTDSSGPHQVENVYVNFNGQWRLVSHVWVNTGTWSTTHTASITPTVYNQPGNYEYVCPVGVYNLEVSYPTPSGVITSTATTVYPGQKFPIKIGNFGETSSIGVGTSTFTVPAFDTPVFQFNGNVDDKLSIEFSVASTTATTKSYSDYNSALVDLGSLGQTLGLTHTGIDLSAAADGLLYDVLGQSAHGDLHANVTLSTVANSVITNPNNLRVVYSSYSGRDPGKYLTNVTRQGDFYVATVSQFDPETDEGTYSWTINLQQVTGFSIRPAPTQTLISNAISISPATIAHAPIVGSLYTIAFTANGGVGPYTWSSNPSGLINANTGVISVIPSNATGTQNYEFSITVSDSSGLQHTSNYSTPILPSSVASSSSGLSLSPASLPAATLGNLYTQTLTASGGTAPYSWSLNGTLPAGLSTILSTVAFDDDTTTITGIPSAIGSNNFTFSVSDSSSVPLTKSIVYGINVVGSILTLTSNLPTGSTGTSYTGSITATGGTSPYTYSIINSSLPAGLTAYVDSSGVNISGTPTSSGISGNITIAASDSGNPPQTTPQQTFTITIS